MTEQQINQIKALFPCQTDYCRNNVSALVKEAVGSLGLQSTMSLYEQWKVLSEKLNNKSKLTCLADKNHRLLLIKFIQSEAADQYKSSYFNRAKINLEYVKCFEEIGPYNFSEVITIVNKLKLIKKYYISQPNSLEGEDHIKYKIKEILDTCNSPKRTENSNLHKFLKIVEFEDRQELINELSKILRIAWSKEKLRQKKGQNSIFISSNQLSPQNPLKQAVNIQTTGENALRNDFELIDYFNEDYKEENSFEAGFEF